MTTEIVPASAIPDPGSIEVERLDVAGVLAVLDETDDIDQVDEYRQRAQALATYLANRLDPGPANRIANMAAVRIGELLGPAEMGRPSHGRLSSDAAELKKTTRSEFRLMARYRAVVEDSAHLSRAQVLDAIEGRRAEERRMAALPPDLAERVASDDDPMTLDDAEQVVADREARLGMLVERIRAGLRTFVRMIGYPQVDEVAERLTPAEQSALLAVVEALEKEGTGDILD